MKYVFTIAAIVALTSFTTMKTSNTIYQFKVPSINVGTIEFAKYEGKKILVVNTASKCGFTPQYEALEKLYEKYKDKLVVVGFPCNQFGGQEPGSSTEIVQFCKKNYGVTFPLAEKIDVKGPNISPVYKWLCNKSENGVLDATITWNFNKFLIDEHGKLLAYFPSTVTPDSPEILKYLN
ncbi:MAG: glutathione peroxidase [Bacteroidota bacterium]|jgi:glutathione peroxidase|nr:glutathione peroxidase [Bacteroidota bacterium]